MQWSDGGLYEGMWVNDKRHGKGVMRFGTGDALWSHGDVFEGHGVMVRLATASAARCGSLTVGS